MHFGISNGCCSLTTVKTHTCTYVKTFMEVDPCMIYNTQLYLKMLLTTLACARFEVLTVLLLKNQSLVVFWLVIVMDIWKVHNSFIFRVKQSENCLTLKMKSKTWNYNDLHCVGHYDCCRCQEWWPILENNPYCQTLNQEPYDPLHTR